jgi:Asp-tRNA(Asn)/Glu-tRNA(Gln) amidotransferase A subunit family amidase
VGVPRSFFYDELDAEVAAAVEAALQVMAGLAREIREISLTPDTDRTLQAAESYAVHATSVEKTPELFQPETLRRIKTGEHITREQLACGRARLRAARESIAQVFTSTDLIVTPTTPIPAPAIAELKQHPDELRPRELLLLRNTRPFNVWGLPTLSTPCGFTRRGLPIGLQIAGPPGRDDLVLEFAHAYERATAWHERRPAIAQTD